MFLLPIQATSVAKTMYLYVSALGTIQLETLVHLFIFIC